MKWYATTLLAIAGSLPVMAAPRANNAATPPSITAILNRAAQATETVAYQGRRSRLVHSPRRHEVRTLEHADGKGRFRIEHSATKSTRRWVLIDSGRERWRIEPSAKRVVRMTEPLPDQHDRLNLKLLLQNYRASLDPKPVPVAARPTYRLRLLPRDSQRMEQTLWIDRSTGLILRQEQGWPGKPPMHRMGFQSINFHPRLSPSLFQFPERRAGMRVVSSVASEHREEVSVIQHRLGIRNPLPRRLASVGMELRAALSPTGRGRRGAHLLYEDGATTLSLFLDPARKGVGLTGARVVPLAGMSVSLKDQGGFRLLRWATGGYRYTLVGDLRAVGMLRAARDFLPPNKPRSAPRN